MAKTIKRQTPEEKAPQSAEEILKEAGVDTEKSSKGDVAQQAIATQNQAIIDLKDQLEALNAEKDASILALADVVSSLKAEVSLLTPSELRLPPEVVADVKPADIYLAAVSGAATGVMSHTKLSTLEKSEGMRDLVAESILNIASHVLKAAVARLGRIGEETPEI